jgi:hypothetical protein
VPKAAPTVHAAAKNAHRGSYRIEHAEILPSFSVSNQLSVDSSAYAISHYRSRSLHSFPESASIVAKSLIEALKLSRVNSPTHFLLHYSLGHGQHHNH